MKKCNNNVLVYAEGWIISTCYSSADWNYIKVKISLKINTRPDDAEGIFYSEIAIILNYF